MSQRSETGNSAEVHTPPAQEFTAIVTEIRELQRLAGKVIFQIALDRSPFPPAEAKSDQCVGSFTAISRLGNKLEAPILWVTQDSAGELWHATTKPLQPGTHVRVETFVPPKKM